MSSSALSQVLKKFEALKKSSEAKKSNEVGKLLDDLKPWLIQLALMPTEGSGVDQKVLTGTINCSYNY
jgi:hypothetical protein